MGIIDEFIKKVKNRRGRRLHLFEFTDQTWFPKSFRAHITDVLQYNLTSFDIYAPVVPKIKEVMQKLSCRQIIDLCSGSTGPLLRIQEILTDQENYPVSVTLTDKYPNAAALQRLCQQARCPMNYLSTSVDATAVPGEYQGMRTLFSSFHHFRPAHAKKILQDAVDKNAPIGIFEFTERTVGQCINILLEGPVIPLRIMHTIRPFKWSRFFWTYIIPAVSVVYTWDALVSHLRSYSIPEWKVMVSELKSDNYIWETGRVRSDKTGIYIFYLIGYNKQGKSYGLESHLNDPRGLQDLNE